MQKYGWICFSAVMLNPLHSVAATEAGDLFRPPSLKLGIVSSSGNIKVSKGNEFNDVPFNTSSSISPVVMLIQPPAYFSAQGRWGYHTELSASYFDLEYDDERNDKYHHGDYHGYSISFTPVLFYQWGNKKLCSHCKSLRLELGAGINYLNSEGNLITDSGENITFHNIGFGLNSHLGMVLNLNKWEFGWRMVMPTRVDDNNVKVRHAVSSLSLGYRF